VGARSTRDDHQALAVSIFSGLAAPGTQPEGTDTSQKHSTGVVAHDSLERGRGRDKVCGKRGGRRGRECLNDLHSDWSIINEADVHHRSKLAVLHHVSLPQLGLDEFHKRRVEHLGLLRSHGFRKVEIGTWQRHQTEVSDKCRF